MRALRNPVSLLVLNPRQFGKPCVRIHKVIVSGDEEPVSVIVLTPEFEGHEKISDIIIKKIQKMILA
jgi:hypothetical protein